MLQMLLDLASSWWLMAAAVSILICVAFPIIVYGIQQSRQKQARQKWSPLVTTVDGLSDCKLENLKQVESAFRKNLPDLTAQVSALENDSRSMYRGHWISDPQTRLSYPESFEKPVQQALKPTTAYIAGFSGVFLTILLLVLAMVDSSAIKLDPTVRLLALIPLMLGIVSFLLLRDQRNRIEQNLKQLHRRLMLAIERKVPVYSQAGETAVVLSRFVDHDQLMTQSVSQLATRVDKMAGGEITEAVTNALKFVLTATIGPALQKSTDSLSMLSVALEKQMRNAMNTLGDRMAALEFEQKESAKFLKNQYETVTSTLLQQQEMSFTQLRKVQELMLSQITDEQKQTLMMLTENQQRTLNSLTDGQQRSYQTLSNEQQTALQSMTATFTQTVSSLLSRSEESQKTLSDQYGTAWSQIQSGLNLALTSLNDAQLQLFTSVQTKQDELSNSMQTRHESLATALQTHQESLATSLATRQDELVKAVTAQQDSLTGHLKTSQETLATRLQTEISQVTGALTEKLALLTDTLTNQQTQFGSMLTSEQEKLGKTLTTSQTTINEMLKSLTEQVSGSLLHQQEQLSTTLTTSQSSINEMLKNLTEEISGSLLTQQEQLSATLTTGQSELASSLQTLQADLTNATLSRQSELATSLQSQQTGLADSLHQRQDELTSSLQTRYNDLTRAIQTHQVDLAAAMQARQDEVMAAFQEKQAGLVMSLKESQETLYAATNRLQEQLSTTFHAQQLAAIAQMQTAQDQTLQKVADYQLQSINSLTEDVAKNLGGYLDQYLEPVSKRLIASADVLVAAQAYADKVQDAFEMQREQVANVEAGMKEAIQSFVETRTTMMSDLADLRKSTQIMSGSADKMSAIFEGSESGLSDSIKLLSGNMTKLGEDLERITSGSAKTARDLQEQIEHSHELNQRQISDLTTQINTFSDELATRIEQLTLGFTQVTEDLVKNVRGAINDQNDTLTGNMRHLVEVMSEESRSMSLFAQQINMDIDSLSSTLSTSVANFNDGVRSELGNVLTTFDKDIADVLKRLAVAANELGDAVEALPEALAPIAKR